MIRHLRHDEIDKARWDALLTQCADRIWYMQSWVLDICSPGWEALVDEEQGALMPLLWRRRFGIDYLFQPYALQQQGVFARQPSGPLDKKFLEAVPKRFKYWDIYLNERMHPDPGPHDALTSNVEQTLVLQGDAEALRAAYSKGVRRNLKKSAPLEIHLGTTVPAKDLTHLWANTTGRRFGSVPKGSMHMLERLIQGGYERGQCRTASWGLEGELNAAACFMEWEGRSIVLKTANDEVGLQHQAMFHITDHYITAHAGTGLLLDFAGSNTPSVARFNAGFGARSTVYLRLRRNLLPLPLKWFKT